LLLHTAHINAPLVLFLLVNLSACECMLVACGLEVCGMYRYVCGERLHKWSEMGRRMV
jgi:hypothetical protein